MTRPLGFRLLSNFRLARGLRHLHLPENVFLLASVVRTCVAGPRLSVSNPRVPIGWPTHAVNSQHAPALLSVGIHPRVLSQAIQSHEYVAIAKGRKPQSGHAINLRAMPYGGNSEPNRRARAGAKSRPDASGRYACFQLQILAFSSAGKRTPWSKEASGCQPRSGGRMWPMATAMGRRSGTRNEPRQGRQK